MGIGVIALIIGPVIYLRSGSSGQALPRNGMRAAVLITGTAFFLIGCAPIKVPMEPHVGKMEIREPIPLEAGLLITQEAKNYIFSGKPESMTGGARQHEFPLGEALEFASLKTFSQIFQHVILVRTSTEAEKYKIVIEPKIEDFHFRYDQLSYGGFAVAVLSKIRVQVVLNSGGAPVWQRTVDSPEQKKGPWVLNFNSQKDLGESASDALVFTLQEIAMEIYKDTALRKITEER